MGDDRAKRIDDALSSLVEAVVPSWPGEDHVIADDRHEDALALARSMLERSYRLPIDNVAADSYLRHDDPAITSDVNHASDLIKKQLLRGNSSPERAVQFSNLYARLLTQPVLSQKWGILYLLYQLADFGPEIGKLNGSPKVQSEGQFFPRIPQNERPSSSDTRPSDGEEAILQDAFSSGGLHRLPNRMGDRRAEKGGYSNPNNRDEMRNTVDKNEDTGPENEKKTFGGDPEPRPEAPSEAVLLRELPFTLQGLSTTNLPFVSLTELAFPSTLPLPIISLLHTLAEPSLLYRSLSDFVQSREDGLVGQSLRSAVGIELRSYLGLIAVLEGEIRRALALVSSNESQGTVAKSGVTLKRCVVWTRDATMGLRLMSLMVERTQNKKGGQLISMIHAFSSSHGDPFVAAFADRMLIHVTRPFYDMLRQWIYDGELSDPFREFFVIEQNPEHHDERDNDPRRAPAMSVWKEKYHLDEAMIPSIITEEFAKKVFLIGKSLNFIRYGCGDSAWVEAYCKEASRELRYGDTATLETSIDKAYQTTMARLIELMDNKFQLFEHLRALKKYLLLGQGDFIALLMESLSINLDRPAGTQYRHILTAQLDHAIQGSNARYDSQDVRRRLDARLLEQSHGEIGWDVFTLEYKVDAPVDVVITPWANRQYLAVFNFLWRIKRVEYALGSTWRRCVTGARGVLAAVDSVLSRDWKVARCCIAEMIHFVNQLQYYILFEVIEASWDQLQAAITKPDCTLDSLIDAHTKYLKAITHKGLLGSARSNLTGNREDSFTSQLHYILKIMLSYKEAVDGLYSFSVAEFTRRQNFNVKIETRTAQGKWGLTEKDEDSLRSPSPAFPPHREGRGRGAESPFPLAAPSGDDQMLPALRSRLQDLSGDFKQRVNILLGDLMVQPDVDMKFLGVVMNFNDVYHPKKRRREHREHREKKTPANHGGSVDGSNVGKAERKGKTKGEDLKGKQAE